MKNLLALLLLAPMLALGQPLFKQNALTTNYSTGAPSSGMAPIFNVDGTWHFSNPATGTQTPWASDINANKNNLTNLESLRGPLNNLDRLVITNDAGIVFGDGGNNFAIYGSSNEFNGPLIAKGPLGLFIGNGGGLTNTTPRQYDLHLDFGAACDRQEVQATVTSNSTTVTAAVGTFSASDIGKLVLIPKGGLTNSGSRTFFDFATTIAGFGSSSTITLTAAPSNSFTGPFIFGTSCDTAFQNALNTVASNSFDSTILVPGGCMFTAALQDAGNPTNHHNAQFVLPPVHVYGYPTITIKGASKPSGNYQGHGMLGSVLTTTLTQPAGGYARSAMPRFFDMNDLTVAQSPSLVQPPWFAGPQFCRIVLQDIILEMPHDNGETGWDFYSALQANASDNVVASSQAASGSAMFLTPNSTNAVGIVRPFEASFNEHSFEKNAFYSIYSGATMVGLEATFHNQFYGCVNAYTARNHPNLFVSTADCAMECSNSFYLPAGVAADVTAIGFMKINSASLPEWGSNFTNSYIVNTEDGGFIGVFYGLDQSGASGVVTNAPNVRNGTVPDRVRFQPLAGDMPLPFYGDQQFYGALNVSSNLSTAGLLFGEPANFNLSTPLIGDNGAIVASSSYAMGGVTTFGYNMLQSAWQRFHYVGISTTNNAAWPTRAFENFTVQILMTNNGVIPVQFGYNLFSASAYLTTRTMTIYLTNNTGAPFIVTGTWQDNQPITAATTHFEPFFLWWGNAGGGNPFNATNNACLLDFKMSLSKSSDQSN